MRFRLAFPLIFICLTSVGTTRATLPCQKIHGRAHFYAGDTQFTIWHIGTHHIFFWSEDDHSWDRVETLMKRPGDQPHDWWSRELYGDFVVCPTARFHEGAAQPALVRAVTHAHLVQLKDQ